MLVSLCESVGREEGFYREMNYVNEVLERREYDIDEYWIE